ncbi:hypothetical protein Hanom_Chr09g00853131 [Helianthus anomalus]
MRKPISNTGNNARTGSRLLQKETNLFQNLIFTNLLPTIKHINLILPPKKPQLMHTNIPPKSNQPHKTLPTNFPNYPRKPRSQNPISFSIIKVSTTKKNSLVIWEVGISFLGSYSMVV